MDRRVRAIALILTLRNSEIYSRMQALFCTICTSNSAPFALQCCQRTSVTTSPSKILLVLPMEYTRLNTPADRSISHLCMRQRPSPGSSVPQIGLDEVLLTSTDIQQLYYSITRSLDSQVLQVQSASSSKQPAAAYEPPHVCTCEPDAFSTLRPSRTTKRHRAPRSSGSRAC